MKENTVLLELENYNHLRDFRKYVENNETFAEYSSHYHNGIYIYSTEDAVKSLMTTNDELKEEIKKLEDSKYKNIGDVKEMSLLQFIKWRKQ